MAGWQDAPIVGPADTSKKAAWQDAPVIGVQPAAPPTQQPPQSMAGFVGGNLAKGAAQVAGIPAEVGRQLGEPLTSPEAEKFNKLIKAPTPKAGQPMVGSTEHVEDLLRQHGIITQSAEPRTTAQKYGAAALQALPSAAIPGGAARALPRIGAAVGSGLGGEAGRQFGGAPGQIAGSLLGGAAGGMAGAERGIPRPPSEAQRASQASNIPLTLGQETGNKALTSVENRLRELFPSKGTAHADELAQVTAGAKRVDELAARMGNATGDAEAIGNQLRSSYKNTVQNVDKLRSSQAATDYGAVRTMANGKPVIAYKNTLDALDQIIQQNKNVPAGDAVKIAKQAQQMRDLLQKQGTATVDDAMKTRSAWGKAAGRTGNVFSDIDPNANQMLAKRLFAAVNKDFDDASTAQTPVAQALRKANQNYAKSSQSIDFIKKSALGKLLGEDVTDAAFSGQTASTKAPELIAKRYLSMNPSEARSVTSILQQHDPQMLQDAKSYVLRNGLEQAKNDVPGAPPISFAKFRKEIDKVQPKLEEMGFTKKEIADVKDVTDTMARAGDKAGANPSGTSAALHMGATGAAAFTHPIVAAASFITPYIASKALLTQPGRELLRKAYNSTNGKAQAAAIGALRSQFAQPSQSGGQNQPTPTIGTQLASPPQ